MMAIAHGLECARTVDPQRELSGFCMPAAPDKRECVVTAAESRVRRAWRGLWTFYLSLYIYIYKHMVVRLAGN